MTIKSLSRDEVANPTNLNVEAIAKLEHEALQRRTGHPGEPYFAHDLD